MSRRDALSRVGARLSRSLPHRGGDQRDHARGDRGRPEVTPSTRARQAAVVGTASLIALAPLAVGAPASAPQQPAAQPRTVAGQAPAGGPGLVEGIQPPASLPWLALTRLDQIVPAATRAGATSTPAATGIPATVEAAYRKAEANLAATQPTCHLSWWMLAGIGYVESGHAAGGQVDANGRVLTPILGPVLDGSTPQTATVVDTDRGAYDGDAVHDRAVGPMQFLPATWRGFGADGNGDGTADPQNVYDAALSAGRYLCASGGDLADPASLHTAILRYNPSETYVTNVLAAGQAYRDGLTPPPVYVPSPTPTPTLPLPRTFPTTPRTATPNRTTRQATPTTPRTTPTPGATATPTPRPTSTPTPSRTTSPSPTATPTPSRTAPPTPTPTATKTPKPTPSHTTPPTSPTPSSTTKPKPTPTTTPSPSTTGPTPTASPTTTPSPTDPEPLPLCEPGEDPIPSDGSGGPDPSPTCRETDDAQEKQAASSEDVSASEVPSATSTRSPQTHHHHH